MFIIFSFFQGEQMLASSCREAKQRPLQDWALRREGNQVTDIESRQCGPSRSKYNYIAIANVALLGFKKVAYGQPEDDLSA